MRLSGAGMAMKKSSGLAALVLAAILLRASPAAADTVFSGDFSGNNWLEKFNSVRPAPWIEGRDRATIVLDAERGRPVLQVAYPRGKYGNKFGGVQWKTYLDRAYEHLVLTYRVKFGDGFNFVKGGKLPGLIGGHFAGKPDSVVSGGSKPNGHDGWSARLMWRRRGEAVLYLYHPDQPGRYGEDLKWMVKGRPARFVPGRWHEVRTEIVLNKPGQGDGIVRAWLDGEPALERRDIRFRDTNKIGIDALYFSTFFGGDDATWSATRDEAIYFDGFNIDTAPN